MLIALLLLGILLLIAGGTGLVRGASGIAGHYGVHPLVIGLTVVAFGTSAPELVVNLIGSFRGETDLAFGNVMGSNMANLGLVLGVVALIRPVEIQGQIVRRELPLLMLGSTILLVIILDRPLLGQAPLLTRPDGIVLLLIFSIFVYVMVGDFVIQRRDSLIQNLEGMDRIIPAPVPISLKPNLIFVGLGILGLTIGGHLTISAGSQLAELLGMPPVVVGILFVAIGTSLPELVTSIITAIRNESDLCVGNVVGSNLFNSLLVLPLSAIVRPLPLPAGGIADVVMSLLFAVLMIPVFFLGRAMMGRSIGFLFIVIYLSYVTGRALM